MKFDLTCRGCFLLPYESKKAVFESEAREDGAMHHVDHPLTLEQLEWLNEYSNSLEGD